MSLGRFAGDDPNTPENEGGGLRRPEGLVFDPDNNLIVSSFGIDPGFAENVLRFDGGSGDFIGIFATVGTPTAIVFAPPDPVMAPQLTIILNGRTLSISNGDSLVVTGQFLNGSSERDVLIFAAIRLPGGVLQSVFPPQFQGVFAVPSGFNLAVQRTLGTAGAGLLTQAGSYAFGTRIVDSLTGVQLSQTFHPFVVEP